MDKVGLKYMEALLATLGTSFLKFLQNHVPPALYVPAVMLFIGLLITGAILYNKKQKSKYIDQDIMLTGISIDTKAILKSLTAYIEGDENITETQAQRVYEITMDYAYHEMYRIYTQSHSWYREKYTSMKGRKDVKGDQWFESTIETLNNSLNYRLEMDFSALRSDFNNKLKDFMFRGEILSELQTVTPGEWNHWRHHLYCTIVENTNSIKEYLVSKVTTNKNEFNERLHRSSRNK